MAGHPTANLLMCWDTVHALKAIAMGRHLVPYEDGGTVERAPKFLDSLVCSLCPSDRRIPRETVNAP